MVDTRVNWRLAGTLPIIAMTFILPACTTPGGSPPPSVRTPDGSRIRSALRPILDGEGYRPYYVAGYAGASYGPGLFSRRAAAAGTTTDQPAGSSGVTVERGTWEPE
jgi:hypothetical protein